MLHIIAATALATNCPGFENDPLSLEQGEYEEVELLCQQALTIFDQQLEPNYPHIAFTLHDLANMYQNQG